MKMNLNLVDTACKNCGDSVEKDFCPGCGQGRTVERITLVSIWNEISNNFLGFNSGFVYTVKRLFVAPGDTIRLYLEGHRKNIMKPVQLYLLILTLYFIINSWLGIDFREFQNNLQNPNAVPNEKIAETMAIINNLIHSNFKLILSLSIPFMALSLKLLYRKSGYNFFEFLVFSLFTGSILYIISELLSIIYLYSGSLRLYALFTNISGIIFLAFAITQFFQKNRLKDYFKAACVYFLSQILFMIFLGFFVTLGVFYLLLR